MWNIKGMYVLPVVALLACEALQVVHVGPGPHHHLEGGDHLVAGGAVPGRAKQPAKRQTNTRELNKTLKYVRKRIICIFEVAVSVLCCETRAFDDDFLSFRPLLPLPPSVVVFYSPSQSGFFGGCKRQKFPSMKPYQTFKTLKCMFMKI